MSLVASHFFLYLSKTLLSTLKKNKTSNQTWLLALQATNEDSGKTQETISEVADVLASPTRQRLRSMANASLQLRNTCEYRNK